MSEVRRLLEDLLDERLVQIVLSSPRPGTGFRKVKIRPVLLGGELVFQESAWDGKKEFHWNAPAPLMADRIGKRLEQEFLQLQAETDGMTAAVRVSKKGKMTVSRKLRPKPEGTPPRKITHNRARHYLLPEGVPVPFLVKLGVMTPDGKVAAARYDKFRQINRFLEFIEDVRGELPADRPIRILDFGCGKSYLTFAIYYYLHDCRQLPVSITGLDLKEDVIRDCSRLAEELGCGDLHFLAGDVADFEAEGPVDLVVCLHACDTATDYALAKAVEWDSRVILAVPCCQHELNGQMENRLLEPVLRYGILRERMAALFTDGIRAGLLEEAGYQTQILEFIDMEHTPKNLLIRAVRRKTGRAGKRNESLHELMASLNAGLTLERLLRDRPRQTENLEERSTGPCREL